MSFPHRKAIILACTLLISSFCLLEAHAVDTNPKSLIEDFGTLLHENTYDREPILFNGRELFLVSSTSELKAKERADNIGGSLDKVYLRIKNKQIDPEVKIEERSGSLVILVDDIYILSITEQDLKTSGLSTTEELAIRWKDTLEKSFDELLIENTISYQRRAIGAAFIYLGGLLLLQLLIIIVNKFIRLRNLILISLGIWVFVLIRIAELFPLLRPYQHLVEKGLFRSFFVLLVVIWGQILVNRIVNVIIDQYFKERIPESWSAIDRRLNNALTLKKVIETTASWITSILAALVFLFMIGFNPASVLTGAGLIGLAVGFVSQDLIKGILNGITILIEDQFGVGDVVKVAGHAGVVEDFNLRTTSLRNMEGIKITVPNKEINTVENLTSGFSQVDLQIFVDQDVDLRLALRTLLETAKDLRQEWSHRIISEPELLGLEDINPKGLLLRLTVKTLPMSQWDVKRELNLRVREAFARNGISLAKISLYE
ncbi:MAG: mechanosensitive ion channel family protein [Candidatus Caenarcaniphilales bacterium]|nr:mechanosensitive ion channel family protein [Candidatus Caenarcaniphilales bacterium]